jgi:HEAT repeat protein
LNDPSAADDVRGWAAERLFLHPSRETIHATLRAAGDSSPEVRLWAAYTLGTIAEERPVYRGLVVPVLQRMLSDEGVVTGWWPVRREAQARLACLAGDPFADEHLQADVQAVLKDPEASAEEKKWAASWDHSD